MPRYFNPIKEEVEEISRDPQVIELVKKVNSFIYYYCTSKNLYAWKQFIDDLKADMQLFVYDYELAFRKGLTKKVGYPAYCNAVKQGALNYMSYYSALRRRVNNETISIDASEDDDDLAPIQLIAPSSHDMEKSELLISISQQYGETISDLCQQILDGQVINKEDLKKLRALPNLRQLLMN